MVTEPDTKDIDRSFQDIADDKITEARRTAFHMDWGRHEGSNWNDLLGSKRILILSEAGSGKTYECRAQQKKLWASGEPAFYIELAQMARSNLRDLLSHEEVVRFDAWHAGQSDVATFFLDSIDELKLSLGSFEQALKRLTKAVAGKLARIRVIVTSRPVPFDEQLFREILPVPDEPTEAATSEEFANAVMAGQPQKPSEEQAAHDWRNVALLPLSNAQIKQMAMKEGVEDPDALLADIRKRNAEEFVRRPQDLIELCADWREHRRIRSHRDQVKSNIEVKLKARQDRQEKAALSAEKALEGARRLALAATLSRKLTLRHSVEADRDSDPDDAPLDPSSILRDWSEDERTTLLERSLFGFASYGRVHFHHRSVIEFLAAEHLLALREQGMSIKALKRILFSTTAQGDPVVKPSLRPVSGWIALRNDAIFEEVLKREPDVLLSYGDPESHPPIRRQQALSACVDRHGTGGWRGLYVPNSIQLHRFASPDLGPEVKRLWKKGIENPEIRKTLLNLIGLGKMNDCADIVYDTAIDAAAPQSERIDALDALIHLDDARLASISSSLADNAPLWPNRVARAALPGLFPSHLSVELLCKSLAWIKETKRSFDDISWKLPCLIKHVSLNPEQLDALRQGLTKLAVEGVAWNSEKWPHLASKRQFLIPALASTCLRQIEINIITPEVLRSTAIALCLAEREYDGTGPAKQLTAALRSLSPNNRRIRFEAEDAFYQEHQEQPDPSKRFARVASYRAAMRLGEIDAGWVLESLADRERSVDYRAMILEAAIRIRDKNVELADHLVMLKSHIADVPELLNRLEQFSQQKPGKEERCWQRKVAKQKKDNDLCDAKAQASWENFSREVVNDPDAMFAADRSEGTIWKLWHAMESSGEYSRASGWNRRFIEQHFGKDVADQLRLAVMAYWRNDSPTLRSERSEGEKGVYLINWRLGLAGIAAEAEDPEWINKLSEDEAKLALRYVPIELNGFPAWLDGFAASHPTAVDAVLGVELTAQLDELPVANPGMLHDIGYGTSPVVHLFVPRLRTWLDAGKWRVGNNEYKDDLAHQLGQVVHVLIQHGDATIDAHILSLAKAELEEGTTDALSSVWLPVLMRLDPGEGIDALEKIMQQHPPAKCGPATNWFSSLFGDRDGKGDAYLSSSGFSPELLLRLARLAYQHIRPSDDMVREGGSFSPDVRVFAERGRSNIINALLSTTGAEGWSIKVKLADDPLFADFRDRALAMARERAAEEADAAAFTEANIVALDKSGGLRPLTRDQMFELMIDRLDDIDDTLLRDGSPRAVWALIGEEQSMRQQVAREMRTMANGAYTVDQEAVTADEKKTDIRLRSVGSDHEAIIELKIGEKDRSAAELKTTIKDQLVKKYMAAENCRAGCLLITVNSRRRWRHPETRAMLDLSGLLSMLKEEAVRIEKKMGGSLRLTVRGLDLQPRLPTERATSRRSSE